ncbi:hypothetical protein C2G38_2204277 [Gigaspora rosea]|uniref:Uncharacterized protein n=1 Tax=Gigaspora rosea TaxID=44941 RepID=A0A397UV78_9GLOM|nr:hypothetical protein C2G38_2204277 [Gigaspora rosea]
MSFFKKFVNKLNKKQNQNPFSFENVIYEGKWKDDYVDIKLKIDQLLEVQQNFNIETWNDYRSISSISSYINSEDIGSLNEQESRFINPINKIELKVFLFFIFFIIILVIPYWYIRLFFGSGVFLFYIKEIILRYELSKKDFDYELNPFEILFTQVQINSYFLDGIYIYDTINDLVSGNLKPEHLPIISVCILDNGQFYSVDNRRLFCYQQAILKNAKFTKVPVRIMRETDKSLFLN